MICNMHLSQQGILSTGIRETQAIEAENSLTTAVAPVFCFDAWSDKGGKGESLDKVPETFISGFFQILVE